VAKSRNMIGRPIERRCTRSGDVSGSRRQKILGRSRPLGNLRCGGRSEQTERAGQCRGDVVSIGPDAAMPRRKAAGAMRRDARQERNG
jgi:hypothetical protein